jgi:Polyketide cyclase / dehydrase and lipid transport
MFKIIAVVLIVVILAFLAYVATKPDTFRIERTQIIKATPEAVFGYINDLHRFNSWNPFARVDPSLKLVYSGPASGIGAAYQWDGTGKAGTGHMEIVGSSPPSGVTMRLEFKKPFAADNIVTFTITSDGPGTMVGWAMTGQSTYLQKVFGTIFNMDKTVGGEFDKGLANLKTLAEG